MDVIDRLSKGLQFLKAHAWGQGADRQECTDSPDGFKYCARGALIYGAFTEDAETSWCIDRGEWHKGACVVSDEICDNSDLVFPEEFSAAMEALDDGATAIGGRWMVSVEYNDAIARTKDEVIGMFEAAIRKAKGE